MVLEFLNKLFISPPVHLFHSRPQAKCTSFLIIYFFLSIKLELKLGLIIDVGVKETSEARLQELKCHLMMRREARPIILHI